MGRWLLALALCAAALLLLLPRRLTTGSWSGPSSAFTIGSGFSYRNASLSS